MWGNHMHFPNIYPYEKGPVKVKDARRLAAAESEFLKGALSIRRQLMQPKPTYSL
jgi:hypothetical protein